MHLGSAQWPLRSWRAHGPMWGWEEYRQRPLEQKRCGESAELKRRPELQWTREQSVCGD